MSQQMVYKKTGANQSSKHFIAILSLFLFIPANTVQAGVPAVDWHLYLASKGAAYLLRSAKSSQQQTTSTQQIWKATKNSTAVTNTPVTTQDVWQTGKSAVPPEIKTASAENTPVLIEPQTPVIQELEHPLTPVERLASSRTIFIKSNSLWVKRKSIEDALMKKKEFLALGYAIVKDVSEADLKLEVDHTALTVRYPFTVTHVRTEIVVATGTVHSLRILNDVPGDTADSFVKQAKAARATVPAKK